MHRAFAGRVAYLAGATVLVFGILYQAFVDPWLVLALSVMVGQILRIVACGEYEVAYFFSKR